MSGQLRSQTVLKDKSLQKIPVWLGFHRDGLLLVLALDWLWALLEFSAGATIVGIPAIPFISFAMFLVGAKFVYNKQIVIGDKPISATGKAVLAGIFAGFPSPIMYTSMWAIFAIINAIIPKTKGVSIKMPSNDHVNIGKFTSEYKNTEALLKKIAQQGGGNTKLDCTNVCDCVKFLQKKQMISQEVAERLTEVRKFRNDYVHNGGTEVPSIYYIRLIKRCREEIEAISEKM